MDYDNRDNRRLKELDQIEADASKLRVCGEKYAARVVLLHDYANEWDAEADVWHGPLARFSYDGWFEAAQRTHTPMDQAYIDASPDLSGYDLAVYPHPSILTERTARCLEAYVRQGGVLLLGARAGYKDEFGRCPMRPMPGPAAALTGATVKEFTPVREPVRVRWGDDTLEAAEFNDVLEPEDAQVLGVYEQSWYAGGCALCCKTLGKGRTLYFAGGFNADAAALFLQKLGMAEPYAAYFSLPECVELAVRGKTAFLLNYAGQSAPIEVKRPVYSVFEEKTVAGNIQIPPYGVIALTL